MFVPPIFPVTLVLHLEAARAAYERILETRQQNGHKDSAEDQDKEAEKAEKAKPRRGHLFLAKKSGIHNR